MTDGPERKADCADPQTHCCQKQFYSRNACDFKVDDPLNKSRYGLVFELRLGHPGAQADGLDFASLRIPE